VPITLTCACGKQLVVDDAFAGQPGRCPACGEVFEVPDPAAASPSTGVPDTAPDQYSLAPESDRPAAPPPRFPEYTEELPQDQVGTGRPRWSRLDDVARPQYKLHPPAHVAVATFLLGPGAGFLLLMVNFYRLGRQAAVWGTLAALLLTVVVLLAVEVSADSPLPVFALALPMFLILWVAAKVLQGGAYEEHLRRGGESASGGAAAGIGLLGLGLFFALAIGGGMLYEVGWHAGLGEKLTFGPGEEVYYAKGVTQADANKVGQRLKAEGFFDGGGAKTVLLSRQGGRPIVSFVIRQEALNNPQVLQFFRELSRQLSQEVFAGQPVEIRLCDEYLHVKKTLP
jgi:hypothetical protein